MADPDALTIDELARRVGMTTRNIRAHQTRGLLPAPRLVGRTGRYGPEHVNRLGLIKRLQEEGLNLQAIALVLGGRAGGELDHLRRAVLEPWATEEPVDQAVTDVARRLGGQVDAGILERSFALGVVAPVDEGTVRVLLPAVLRSAEALLEMGVPLAPQVDVVEAVDHHVRAVAEAYVELAREHLVGSLVEHAAVDADALRHGVEALRAIAGDVLMTLFQRAMTELAQDLVEEVVDKSAGAAV